MFLLETGYCKYFKQDLLTWEQWDATISLNTTLYSTKHCIGLPEILHHLGENI